MEFFARLASSLWGGGGVATIVGSPSAPFWPWSVSPVTVVAGWPAFPGMAFVTAVRAPACFFLLGVCLCCIVFPEAFLVTWFADVVSSLPGSLCLGVSVGISLGFECEAFAFPRSVPFWPVGGSALSFVCLVFVRLWSRFPELYLQVLPWGAVLEEGHWRSYYRRCPVAGRGGEVY